MGLVPPELSLDFRPTFVPKTITNFLKEMSMIGYMPERMSKLDDFVKRLEDEMRKIDAFKRELPLCMLLINDAILVLKEESLQCAAPNNKPVLEEFIPVKKECDENQESNRDKKNWMSSVQLWNCDTNATNGSNRISKFEIKRREKETDHLVMGNPFDQSRRTKNGGRVCMPIKGYGCSTFTQMISVKKEDKNELPCGDLSLNAPGIKSELTSNCFRSICDRQVSIFASKAQSSLRNGPQQQGARKQRRCWSPELHHLFVNALQQLGGAQVATPKQIRDLMQVDGLTNDEVKSHLQKYRLHTRKLPATTTTPSNQSLAVLGGLWISQDPHGESSNVSNSQSASPQGPLQSAGIGGTSTTGIGSMEEDDEEDTKSESCSCKSQSEKPVKEYV